ncbi:MAG: hypothetical protein KBG42_03900 [Lachnospiraceae bacterium]|nr:hypothetical protein [Lachnospiraceae bacterium]
MIPEFIDFCKELFPNIDPYTAEQAKLVMDQFEKNDVPKLARYTEQFDLLQGDIFSEIPFVYINDDGEVQTFFSKAELLSNTCDASRDDELLFAAIRPIEGYSDNKDSITAIKHNKRYSLFYIPDIPMENYCVDFELITSISRKVFNELCNKGNVNRIATLTSVGYYMLISKLTVFFLRPEDVETNCCRE